MDAFEAVSVPERSPGAGQRHFTVAEANRALVLVRRIVGDIVRDYARLREHHDAYHLHESKGHIPQAEDARRQYIQTTDRLSELRDELRDIGCELKDCDMGLVDFPARREGRDVLLCWRMGEDSIQFWHELDAGFTGRRPLADEA